MATLIVDRSNVELRMDGAALALYEGGERRSTVPLNLLDRVVLQGQISLETGVLTRLAEEGVAIALLSKRQSRRVAFILGIGHSDAAVRLAQYQRTLDTAWCDDWARRVVISKLRAQQKLVREALAARADCRKPLSDALATLDKALEAAGAAAGSARVRGLEGAAAAAYFKGIAHLFPESLGFSGRNRRPPRDPVNACLSLGYTLLHFDAVRACHVAGIDPLIGFYHRAAFGRESMACDLIEPLRPRVDRWVWMLFRERVLRSESFVQDKGACLLNKGGRSRFYAAYEGMAGAVRRGLRRECAVLARALRHQGEPLLDASPELDDA